MWECATPDVLDCTLASNVGVETLRVVVIMLGVLLLLFAVVRFLNKTRTWSALALGSLALLGITQQAASLGERFTPWRLVLLTVGIVGGLVFMYRDHDRKDGSGC